MTQSTPRNIDPQSPERDRLDGVMQDLAAKVEGEDGGVPFGELVDVLGARGVGPVLLILGLFLLLPIAAVPLVPAAIGLAVAGMGVQLLRGGRGIWMPDRLRRVTIPEDRLSRSLERIQSGLDRMRPVLSRRLERLANSHTSLNAIGIVVAVTGIVVAALGFVPFLPFVLAIHVLLFGIGLTARDGLFVLAGYVWLIPAVAMSAQLAAGLI